MLGTLAMLMLGTAAFACMSMLLAAVVKERERFMGIGQLIMMPLFFASSALYPLSVMPGWLHVIARVNPLTYEVQGLRQMLVGVGGSGEVWLDFLVVAGFFAVMLAARHARVPQGDSLTSTSSEGEDMSETQLKASPEGVPGAVTDPSVILGEELTYAGAGGDASTATSRVPPQAGRTRR